MPEEINPTDVKLFQEEIKLTLSTIYPAPIEIETEWKSIRNVRGLYVPRVDVAVGPFSEFYHGICEEHYDHLIKTSSSFIEFLMECHRQNVNAYRLRNEEARFTDFNQLKNFNRNAQCFMAIEIENEGSRKHLLGSAVNASALGRIAVVIGWTTSKIKAFVRLLSYWEYLTSAGKNSFSTGNILILSPEQFREAIQSYKSLIT
jgi:hypothetical protein